MYSTFVRCLAVSLLVVVPVSAEDWPSFRGARGDGVSTEVSFPQKWDQSSRFKWTFSFPDDGNSSPIVSAGRVFVTCATNQGAQRHLYCLDRANGKQLWVATVEGPPNEVTHKTNPWGAATPVANGERVVVWHGSAGLYCYDFDGNELWKTDPGDVKHIWGYGSSPVIDGDRVVLNFGPGEHSYVLALSLDDGRTLWKHEEPGGANEREPRMVGSWSTPVIVQQNARRLVICSMSTRVIAWDLSNGEIVWTCGGLAGSRGDLCYTSPLIAGNIGVAMGGYKGPAIAFPLEGEGTFKPVWTQPEGQPQRIGSGVVVDRFIYMANAGPGILQCIDLETGKEKWKARSGSYWGSVVSVGNLLYATDQDGTTVVFRANPYEFELVASNKLGEHSNSTPAFSDGEIFLRTFKKLYCISDSNED